MNEQTTHRLIKTLRQWIVDALGHIKPHPDQWGELARCMAIVGGDVRVVFHVRENSITVEACDYGAGTIAELFRQHLVPADGGFSLPDELTRQ